MKKKRGKKFKIDGKYGISFAGILIWGFFMTLYGYFCEKNGIIIPAWKFYLTMSGSFLGIVIAIIGLIRSIKK